ncbi:MAG: TIGR03016 family PEP-CTERM system-associated outer membrane protein [Nitrosomonas sp.]|nr:TIGR03016 family PEP-CTERM system-associated outer membrane protein [Nitrosomonas sp.]
MLFSIIALPIYAGEWRVVPGLHINERYTDNFRLGGGIAGSKGNDEFITQLNPSILINGNARRYRVDVNYLMNNLIYANHSEFNRVRHQLNALGTVELIKDRFFIDGRAMIMQQNASLIGAQGLDNANSFNRRDVNILNVSPYYRHRFGDFATAELRYTHGEVRAEVD